MKRLLRTSQYAFSMSSYYTNLIRQFSLTDFKLKYHGSVLGYLWSLLNPLLIFGTLYLVFSIFMRFDVENYHLFLLLGIVVWTFFSESTLNSMQSLYSKSNILKKIYFPRTIVVIASNFTTFFGFLLNLFVFFIFMFFTGVGFSLQTFLLLFYVLCLFFISLGMSYILSALNLRFLDIGHIWRIFLQIGFWITPIIYPLSLIPEQYHNYFLLNPLYLIIEGFRYSLLGMGTVTLLTIFLTLFYTIVIFVLGTLIYKKLSYKFAEWV